MTSRQVLTVVFFVASVALLVQALVATDWWRAPLKRFMCRRFGHRRWITEVDYTPDLTVVAQEVECDRCKVRWWEIVA